MSTEEIDETELPILYGLWQLIPTDELDKIQPESLIIKSLIQIFYWITLPVLFLFYGQSERPVNTQGFLHKAYIALIISIIPIILGLLYKYKNVPFSRQTIMVGIWATMFAVITVIYAS